MERRLAIFGDVHANLEALNAVLDDCRREGVTDFLCTGDVVGYNASPKECMRIIRELGCPVVKGNHDYYVASLKGLADFQPNAAAVVEWTRRQLDDEEMRYLRELPFSVARMGVTLVHSTMDNPETFGYVFDHLQAEASFSHQVTPLAFHGHTHCPIIFERQLACVYQIDPQDMTLPIGRKYFINPGSVGQPRDGNPRSSYVIYEPKERRIRYRRIEYDVAGAQARIRKAGLPERLAQRLEVGQ